MHDEHGSWEDVGGDPSSSMQTRQVWGGGMDGLDLDDWNVAIWEEGKPVLAFHKFLHRITFDPAFISAEQIQEFVDEVLEEMEAEKSQKKSAKPFWRL